MNLEKLAQGFGKAIGKWAFNKKEDSAERININQMGPTDLFKISFNKLFHSGDYNKAENLIFNELENNNSPEVYEIAVNFYNSLLEKSDEELNNSNFKREEIYQGLNDIKKFNVQS